MQNNPLMAHNNNVKAIQGKDPGDVKSADTTSGELGTQGSRNNNF